ncbi:fatty acid oxidation complex subunit alpha FadB [Echinimonas agarilytica]|uniref:enoyl-CoA hydratase n=1 Tax=Echinimonas agarilytica TaxID=1215918 RepID=A0AA41W3E7_9GAMM|nr:fatty acid oxidation complex subunit alpha FadB [Echinimonas agarilytica]MCM2678072.1 fatty acid oxidation complex subunit alpha FadB [Echinimonas agarilytica]
MIFESNNIKVSLLDNGIAELCFDAEGSVNKLDRATLQMLDEGLEAITNSSSDIKGVLVSSAKDSFIVGADITEFLGLFALPDGELANWLTLANKIFNKLEDLPLPTASAIRGFALGGGMETILSTDFRVADETATVGLPETKLGIMPGFGGTVRLPRLIGADNALEWITTGKNYKAKAALAVGAVDAVVAKGNARKIALEMLTDAAEGRLDWQCRRAHKVAPLTLSKLEAAMSFTTAKGMVAMKAGKHYPAPMMAVTTVEASSTFGRQQALENEQQGFIKLAKSDVAQALVGIFLNDQYIKSLAKKAGKSAKTVNAGAVLGAGIMGGGIAYQGASRGTSMVMKDINQDALELGLSEASKLLNKQLDRGRIKGCDMAKILNSIVPSLEYSALAHVDAVVEAVVEHPAVKGKVLAEVEEAVGDNTIITSNTSTISINQLAKSLKDPSRFCGMHFFNPVHRMPLVEIIRGENTSDETIATIVAWAAKMGKSPVVVNDCPGFFVNRVLFPYFGGFTKLLADGVDFERIDRIMEKQFGWPMGPAYLLDVVGLDTAHHAQAVMAEGFPERMAKEGSDAIDLMFENKRFGQKNGHGFYQYTTDKRGKPKKVPCPDGKALLATERTLEIIDEDIIARVMIPMILETVRCLEESIIASPAEADIALVYGLGFPPFRGGVFRYLETIGLPQFVELADRFASLGALYQVTPTMRSMADNGQTYLTAAK